VFGAAIRSREQRIFPVERDGADGAFDGIVVELDTAIVDEARQTFPARQGVPDCFGELALLELIRPSFARSHGSRASTSG
jgi:hypothetical protein